MAFDLSEVLKDVSTPETGRDTISYLPYASLIPDPKNGYSMDGLAELARSIELVGLQQPLRVSLLVDNTVQILSGHRRHAAIGLIIDRNPKAFPDGIPCIIDRGEASPALRELQLLLGNADNRKLTAADEAQQLDRISDCIRRLEGEGYKFPGRHRDWLSKMSGMSKSKIGRLEAIQKHLSTTWLKLFSSGKLPESVAYAMQQVPEKYQEILYDLCVSAKPRVDPASLIEYNVKSFAQSVTNAESMVCTVDGSGEPCVWKEQLITTGNQRPGWSVHYGRCSSYYHCSACCSTCDRLDVCETVCPKLREKAQTLAVEKEKKDAAKKAEQDARREQSRKEFEERRRKDQEITDGIWRRLGERRRALGLDVPTVYSMEEPDDEYIAYVVEVENNGGAAEDPFSFLDLYAAQDLCSLADRLQCSLDYLYGRSETPQPESALEKREISLRFLGWLTGTAPGGVKCWARFMDDETTQDFTMMATYDADADAWFCGDRLSELSSIDQKCIGWWPIPDENAPDLPADLTPQPVSVSDTAPEWQSGYPEDEGWYVVKTKIGNFDHVFRRVLYWDEGKWWKSDVSEELGLDDHDRVVCWCPLPPEEGTE